MFGFFSEYLNRVATQFFQKIQEQFQNISRTFQEHFVTFQEHN